MNPTAAYLQRFLGHSPIRPIPGSLFNQPNGTTRRGRTFQETEKAITYKAQIFGQGAATQLLTGELEKALKKAFFAVEL